MEDTRLAAKPPLGLMPVKEWKRQRYNAILSAMFRYSKDKVLMPVEWIDELGELSEFLYEKK